MDKRIFFDTLHRELAIKYGVTPKDIEYIRLHKIFFHRTRVGIIIRIKDKLKRAVETKSHKEKLIKFLMNCNDKKWADITRTTKFDKEYPLQRQPIGVSQATA